MKKTVLLTTIILIACCFDAFAESPSVPPLINYQGTLTGAGGQPIPNSTKMLEFKIYDAASGGIMVWGPQIFNSVPVINGQFNVILGTTDTSGRSIADAFNSNERFLGITVDDSETELTPRQQILSAPYSLQAGRSRIADNVVDGAITQQKRKGFPVMLNTGENAVISDPTGSYNQSHTDWVDIVNPNNGKKAEVKITTYGHPVFLGLYGGSIRVWDSDPHADAVIEIVKMVDGEPVVKCTYAFRVNSTEMEIPISSCWCIDNPEAGVDHHYKARIWVNPGDGADLRNVVLFAYEL